MNATPVSAIRRAVDAANGQASLARQLSGRTGRPISQAQVWNWLHRDSKVTAELCPDIEALTGVRCEELRPDVNWSVLRGTARGSK